MSLQVNEHCHRLFKLTTSYGALKIYIPEHLEWTNKISQHYLVTEALLPICQDDKEEARLYLETKVNEFVKTISKRDLPPPRFILTNIFSLDNQTALADDLFSSGTDTGSSQRNLSCSRNLNGSRSHNNLNFQKGMS
jgi:hypothetical protein